MTTSPQIISFQAAGTMAEVTFSSSAAGMCHQLYVDGRLAAWTDTPQQRSFYVAAPVEVAQNAVVIAVAPADRARAQESVQATAAWRDDAASRNGVAWRPLSAAMLVSFAQDPSAFAPDDTLAIFGDHASGTMDPVPLASAAAWPPADPRWAFGQDRFARGGFGLDGALAPGLGMGPFGLGGFGIDTRCIELSTALPQEGLHALTLERIDSLGRRTELARTCVLSTPPPSPAPPPPQPLAYDAINHVLTVTLQ